MAHKVSEKTTASIIQHEMCCDSVFPTSQLLPLILGEVGLTSRLANAFLFSWLWPILFLKINCFNFLKLVYFDCKGWQWLGWL